MIGIMILIPVFVVVAPIIYFTDKGPVFYNANRIGKDGKLFKMYKFRSMYVNAPDIRNSDGSTYNGDDDPRVTKIGKFIRKTSIDEFPQFINVLIGDMSVIGPRPDPPDDMDIYTEEQKTKLRVRPGITGYNQAYFRNSIVQNEKFANDVYYANNISFMFDIRIFVKTIMSVLKRDNVYSEVAARDQKETPQETPYAK
jgi:lipopolysaccharide/colanic/teichoic acid biosynthesis glycosyltransferase